jgi:hypothetical protein
MLTLPAKMKLVNVADPALSTVMAPDSTRPGADVASLTLGLRVPRADGAALGLAAGLTEPDGLTDGVGPAEGLGPADGLTVGAGLASVGEGLALVGDELALVGDGLVVGDDEPLGRQRSPRMHEGLG